MKYIGLFDEKEDIVTKEKLDAKQDKITVSGILKGDGAGGVSEAVADEDYATCTNLRNDSAEGSLAVIDNFAVGDHTFAEGYATATLGDNSHAEGTNTTASHLAQHVQGEFNIVDDSTASATTRGNYAHIVGNGTASNARSNAHTLDWSGNAWFAGDVYVGSTSGTNKDEGSKKLITADEVPKGAVYTATLTTTAWHISGAWKQQYAYVPGLKSTYNAAPFVDVALSGTDAAADAELAAAWLGISASAYAGTGPDSLTVKFPATVDTPTVNIPIRVTTYD